MGGGTGRVAGRCNVREEKALAIKRFAREQGIGAGAMQRVRRSSLDRWMLRRSDILCRQSRGVCGACAFHGWQMLAWTHESLAGTGRSEAREHNESESERTAVGIAI